MACRWMESFDIDFNSTNMPRKYDNTSGSFSTSTGRLQQASGLSNSGGSTPIFRTKDLGAQRTWFIGIAMKPATLSAEQKICILQNGANEQVSLWIVPGTTGKCKFRVKRGSTTLITTANEYSNGFWCYVEWKTILDTNGADGTVELRVNESVDGSATGIDTTNDASGTANKVQFELRHDSGQWLYDDVYICDDQTANNNTYLGDRCVEGKLATAEGNRNQWTPNSGTTHFNRINEGTTDDDSSYLYVPNNQDGKVELFTIADVTQIVGTVNAVQISYQLRMDSSGTDKVRLIFRSGGGAEATGPDQTVSSVAGYVWYQEIYDQDPVAAAAWTVANFNAMQIGLESRP